MLTCEQSWPRWWKIVILLNISFFNLLGNLCTAGIPPIQMYLIKDLGITLVQSGHVATYTLLTLGLAVCAFSRVHLAKMFTHFLSEYLRGSCHMPHR